ncbi:MAG: AAA family ATPase, partial [Hyphomonas sp.]|nr:AAA family ATPase [Hyphomonas sp.]
MMLSLSIRDFVLISRLDLSPAEGFTALTGETGAGKSIILDALSLALGGQADRSVIRHGAAQASVAAEFAPPASHPVWALLAAQGVAAQDGETLTLKRLVRAEGPARAFINDQPVSAALLAEAGELLVEVHGQHAASSLLRPAAHRRLLDQFAGNEALLAACAATHAARVDAREARAALE